jgi:phosphatidylinositol alpha-1,6-mannosyltransferase
MARQLRQRGLDVVYAARGDFARGQEFYGDAFTVQPIGGRDWRHRKDLSIVRTLASAWKRHRPAAVVCLNCKVARVPLLMRPLTGWKVAVIAHGMEITKNRDRLRRRFGLKWVFGSADLSVAVSRYTRARVLEFGVPPDHVRVLPCGVDPERFRRRDEARARARFGLSGRPILLTLSRLVSRKGHDLVIRALPEILRAVPDALYVIAGPPNPPYEERLRDLARAHGVSDAVRFLGYVPSGEMADLYSASDVYVMASRTQSGDDNFEGFGITYLEANACGVPVVGADSGGVADAIADGETGYLVPPDDVGALAARLGTLLADPAAARRMGAAGRARVEREFTWDRIAARFLEALEDKTGRLLLPEPVVRPYEKQAEASRLAG